jgi:hypothetical protein
MREGLPFDHRPDPRLGAALRHALDAGDDAAFVARVLARAAAVRPGSWDTVLARWARLGLAAAMLVALAAGYAIGRTGLSPSAARPSVAETLLTRRAPPPEVDVVLASVVGN